ncbi:uncharacterized protein LOC142877075 [Nelusetta ayraudi]|uniref:uncharacterized protein LOC142877075 n=1 Tax=Nelusetta ayraudi TaxID=303726 RepID=UPI003F6EB2EB
MSGLSPRPGLKTLVLTPQRIPDFLIPSHSPRLTRTQLPLNPEHVAGMRSSRLARSCDLDQSTRAALSLPHLARVTTPYGFNAVLATSPCTHRRESLYHRRPLAQDPQDEDPPAAPSPIPGPISSRSRLLRPIQALGRELQSLYRRPPAEDPQDLVAQDPPAALSPSPGPFSSRSRVLLLGQQLVQDLQRPMAALKARSPAYPDS